MAHAYSTIADGGDLISGTLASTSCAGGTYVPEAQRQVIVQQAWPDGSCPGPVGITAVNKSDGRPLVINQPVRRQVPDFTPYMDLVETKIMRTVVTEGTGYPNANVSGLYVVGKTGTTSDYRDAWFIGFTPQMTVAVWVGYVDDKSMTTAYGGKPVYGATFPAIIFHKFLVDAYKTMSEEAYDRAHNISQAPLDEGTAPTSSGYVPVTPSSTDTTTTTGDTTPATTTPTAPTTGTTGGANTAPTTGTTNTAPTTPAPTGPGGGTVAP
jgi:penicillin-binding protein 1A